MSAHKRVPFSGKKKRPRAKFTRDVDVDADCYVLQIKKPSNRHTDWGLLCQNYGHFIV